MRTVKQPSNNNNNHHFALPLEADGIIYDETMKPCTANNIHSFEDANIAVCPIFPLERLNGENITIDCR